MCAYRLTKKRRGSYTTDPLSPNKSTPGFDTRSDYNRKIAAAAAKQKSDAAEATRNDELAKSAAKAAARQVALETLFVEASPELAAKCPAISAEVEGTQEELLAAFLKAAQAAFEGQRHPKSVKDKVIRVIRLNGLDARQAATWSTTFEHIRSLGGFVEDGIPSDEIETPAPAAQPAPTLQEESYQSKLNRLDGDSREGRKQLVDAAELEMFKVATPLYEQWLTHLYRDHNGFVPSPEDRKFILNTLFPRNNWSYIQPENYNRARRWMIAQRRWPDTMLTADERNALDMEATSYFSDYATNREVKRRLRDAQN